MNIVFIQTGVMKYSRGGVNRQAYVQIWEGDEPVMDKNFSGLTLAQYNRFQSLQNQMSSGGRGNGPDEIANGERIYY